MIFSRWFILKNINLWDGLCGNVPQVEVCINFKPVMSVPMLFLTTELSYHREGHRYNSKVFEGCFLQEDNVPFNNVYHAPVYQGLLVIKDLPLMQPKNTPIFPVAFQHHFRAVQAGDVQAYLAQVVLPKDIQFNTDFVIW